MKKAFNDMKIRLADALFEEFFTEFDPNGDGSLDYEEFLSQMRTHIHGGTGIVKRTSTAKKEKKAEGKDISDDGSNNDIVRPPPPAEKKKEEETYYDSDE